VKHLYTLRIHYANGSSDALPFDQYTAVRDYYQYSISYSGGRVKRVEVEDHTSRSTRAIWDQGWNDESKARGLEQ